MQLTAGLIGFAASLVHVSDATAARYLSVLAKEGKIMQVGKQGKGVLYIKTP